MSDTAYGSDHQARRAELLPLAWGTECPECGEVMLETDDLDLDHSTPLALDSHSVGDVIVHARCNRSKGGRLGYELKLSESRYRPSRTW